MLPALVAVGGALGALARYGVERVVGLSPWSIMATNVVGSFMLGVLAAALALDRLPEAARAGLAVGLLGAFTTFSTFSLQTLVLVRQGEALQAGLYVAGSVLLGVAAATVGDLLGRVLLR